MSQDLSVSLPELRDLGGGLFSQLPKSQDYCSISFWIKGILL